LGLVRNSLFTRSAKFDMVKQQSFFFRELKIIKPGCSSADGTYNGKYLNMHVAKAVVSEGRRIGNGC